MKLSGLSASWIQTVRRGNSTSFHNRAHKTPQTARSKIAVQRVGLLLARKARQSANKKTASTP